jgi:hypothetical protein
MTLVPSTTDQFFEIVAGVYILVVRREVVENLGGSMNACRSQANTGPR